MAPKLIRYRLRPHVSWLSPWQADTLMGSLACHYIREHGAEGFHRVLGSTWAEGRPPFVLSDAFPGDLLPSPACLPLLRWPDSQRKLVKRTEWLLRDQFRSLQAGTGPSLPEPRLEPFHSFVRLRNTLDRASESSGDTGNLYSVPSVALGGCFEYLSVYARVEEGQEALLSHLLSLLARHGFGGDSAVGQGQFELLGGPEAIEWLDAVEAADGWVSLSTFQPQPADPSTGYWKSFVKYPRLGPDPGVVGVFKRPQWMLRPGACFFTGSPPLPWYGGLIRAEDLLPPGTLAELAERRIAPMQAAFALAVPMKWLPQYEEQGRLRAVGS